MKKFLLPLLTTCLISGCAYYQGLHDNQTQAPATPEPNKKNVVKVNAPPAPKQLYNENQNNPVNTSAKMISPITQ